MSHSGFHLCPGLCPFRRLHRQVLPQAAFRDRRPRSLYRLEIQLATLQARAEPQGANLLASLKDARSFGRQVLPDDDSSFLWGPVGSGLTADPAETLAQLYDRFVTRYDGRPRQHRDDATVWRPVRDRLVELRLADRLQPKTIASPFDRVEFDHAWKNGEWHCFQPLSFDLANEENIREKARRWAGKILALKEATEPFKPYFFVGAPSDRALEGAYRAALKILTLSPLSSEVIEETRLDDLVGLIAKEIHQADECSAPQNGGASRSAERIR